MAASGERKEGRGFVVTKTRSKGGGFWYSNDFETLMELNPEFRRKWLEAEKRIKAKHKAHREQEQWMLNPRLDANLAELRAAREAKAEAQLAAELAALEQVPPGFRAVQPTACFPVRARRVGATEDDELGKLYINMCTLDAAELGSEATLLLDKGLAVIQYTVPYALGDLREEADPFGLPTPTVDFCVTPKTLQFCTNPAFQRVLFELAIKKAEPLLPPLNGSPQRVSFERWHRLEYYVVWGCGPRRVLLEVGKPAQEATLQTPARKPNAAEAQQQQPEQQRAEQQQAEQLPAEPAGAEVPTFRKVAKQGKGKNDDATRQFSLFVDLPKIKDYTKELTVLFNGDFEVLVKSQDAFLSVHNYCLTVPFETSIRKHETKHKNWDKRARTLELLIVTDAPTPEAARAKEALHKDKERRIQEQKQQQVRQIDQQASEALEESRRELLEERRRELRDMALLREHLWMRREAGELGRPFSPNRPLTEEYKELAARSAGYRREMVELHAVQPPGHWAARTGAHAAASGLNRQPLSQGKWDDSFVDPYCDDDLFQAKNESGNAVNSRQASYGLGQASYGLGQASYGLGQASYGLGQASDELDSDDDLGQEWHEKQLWRQDEGQQELAQDNVGAVGQHQDSPALFSQEWVDQDPDEVDQELRNLQALGQYEEPDLHEGDLHSPWHQRQQQQRPFRPPVWLQEKDQEEAGVDEVNDESESISKLLKQVD